MIGIAHKLQTALSLIPKVDRRAGESGLFCDDLRRQRAGLFFGLGFIYLYEILKKQILTLKGLHPVIPGMY
jgi:hypothetical protein